MPGIIESLTARIENLESLAEDQARALEQLRAEVAWRDGKKSGDKKPLEPLFTYEEISKTAQQQLRDGIIERAKEDIFLLKSGPYYKVTTDNFIPLVETPWVKYASCKAEFIVNKEKRTVVALMRGHWSGTLYSRGIAKCAPDDCFNVHIGKAIALRRALGLDVPDAYLNAPQPTEVRAGDYVLNDGKYRKVVEKARKTTVQIGSLFAEKGRIIDDSREEVSAD